MITLTVPEHVRRKRLDDPLISLPGLGECWITRQIYDKDCAKVHWRAASKTHSVSVSSLVHNAKPLRNAHSAWCVRPGCPNAHINFRKGARGFSHISRKYLRVFRSKIREVPNGHIVLDVPAYTYPYGDAIYRHDHISFGVSNIIASLYLQAGKVPFRIIPCTEHPACINPRHTFIIPNYDGGGANFLEVKRYGEMLANADPFALSNAINTPARKEPVMSTTNASSTVKVVTRAEYTLPVPNSTRLPVEALQELLDVVKHLPASTPVTFKVNGDRLEAITIIEEA